MSRWEKVKEFLLVALLCFACYQIPSFLGMAFPDLSGILMFWGGMVYHRALAWW